MKWRGWIYSRIGAIRSAVEDVTIDNKISMVTFSICMFNLLVVHSRDRVEYVYLIL